MEPLETYFCYYLKSNIRHYGTYSNCGHEGSNNALKHCAAKVTPRHNIDKSLRILVDGSDVMMAKKKHYITHLLNTTQTRAKLIVSQYLVRRAAVKLEELVL